MRFWDDHPSLLAGRDLRSGGTWMGLNRNGRFAALTNFREAEKPLAQPPSRGELVSAFLTGDEEAAAYWQAAKPEAYSGFNLICGELTGELWHFSNRGDRRGQRLAPGIYGISNHLLDTPWPKVAQGKSDLALALRSLPGDDALFALLRDESTYDLARLPRTGVSLQWEELLSAAFVRSADYGTRSSTVLTLDRQNTVSADEQSFQSDGQATARYRFRFGLQPSGSCAAGRTGPA